MPTLRQAKTQSKGGTAGADELVRARERLQEEHGYMLREPTADEDAWFKENKQVGARVMGGKVVMNPHSGLEWGDKKQAARRAWAERAKE